MFHTNNQYVTFQIPSQKLLRILLSRAAKQARKGVHLCLHAARVTRLPVEQVDKESIGFGRQFSYLKKYFPNF